MIAKHDVQPYLHVRHLKSGGTYFVVCTGLAEWDGATEMVVYRGEIDGRHWVRPINEFCDGRFAETSRGALSAMPCHGLVGL